ncbi:MAG TPA: lytic transglycosylase domain-containing protein [Spirochaetia bacterium]|nr:lytic transglycosylase domain-containing protein [Spirochaetia bacterium]
MRLAVRLAARGAGRGLLAFLAPLGLLGAGVLFLLLVIYGVLPVAGSGPGSLNSQVKTSYQKATAGVNPPVVSYYGFERSHLLDWSLLYALDFFRSQVQGRTDLSFDALTLGRELAPRFAYRSSLVTVTREGQDGKQLTSTSRVQLLTRADTFRGIYLYTYQRVSQREVAPDGTVTITSREVPAGVVYTPDWRRLDSVLAQVLGRGDATSDDRTMVLEAAAAFSGTQPTLDWLGGGPAATTGPGGASVVGVPSSYLPYFQAAAAQYGVPWHVLAAIARVESDFDPYAVGPPNYTGELAQGMMQILPSTWAEYAVKAYGVGQPDPFAAADSIFTAAHLLAADGAGRNLPGALFLYNHSQSYVQEVLFLAGQMGQGLGGGAGQ